MIVTTPIIPIKQTFFKVDAPHELDLEAICVFAAVGFFLDEDTYYKDTKVLRPATTYTLDNNRRILKAQENFKWHYTPRALSFEQALEEFSVLFETIIDEQTRGKKVILPLSGGIDSRTQAAALKNLNSEVYSYSYEFKNGYPETKIAKQIAKDCDFDFQDYKIKKGYLWDVIDELMKLNDCYSDFTSPRQMAISNQFDAMGDVFSLGHWGDVLFDSMNLPQLSSSDEVQVIMNKLVKRGGLKFAESLWELWNLQGNFKEYFRDRITILLDTIEINNTNAKLRAFKSKYWAPRWTSVSLSVFNHFKPITLPYYDDRMCKFICEVPEEYLKDRQLQIAYIKKRSPELAKVEWQDQRPFNLYNYHLNKTPNNIAYKVFNKLKRELKAVLGNNYIQRNWELQFLGEQNELQLKRHLLDSNNDDFIPISLIKKEIDLFFNKDALEQAHAINMLLVFSKFNKQQVPIG